MHYDLLLRSLEKHITLDDHEVSLLSSFIQKKAFKKKAFLFRVGETCNYEYFINEGCLRSFYVDHLGIEHTTMFAIEGWWTGNLKSFITNTKSEFYLQALENTEVFLFDRPKIDKMYKHIPKLERYFRILLQNRLIKTQDRVSNHLSVSAKERYLDFQKQYATIEQRVSQKHIASYLGITAAYLSRLRNRMIRT